MKSQLKIQVNLDICNQETAYSPNSIYQSIIFSSKILNKRKNLNEDKHNAEKEEIDFEYHHNDFSDVQNKRLDEYSDDEFLPLQKEIDSFRNIKAEENDKDNYLKNKTTENSFNQKSLLSKCNKKIQEESEKNNALENLDDDLKNDFSIWQKHINSSNNLYSQKHMDFSDKIKMFIPKNHKLEKFQKQKIKDLSIDTNNIVVSVVNNRYSDSANDLNLKEKQSFSLLNKQNSNSYYDLNRNTFSNSSFSTANNSYCNTPISSPQPDVKRTLNGSPENLVFSKKENSNKNLYECFFENNNFNLINEDLNNPQSLKICKINSFCTKSENEINYQNPQNNNLLHPNYFQINSNKMSNNPKINKNSCSNSNVDNNCSNVKINYPLNINNFYDISNINKNALLTNGAFINNSIYQNTNNFSQVPLYQGQTYYNNYNIQNNMTNLPSKRSKFPNDPLNVLRENNNFMVRSNNGKNAPFFEEPHNRINLENILRGKDKRTTLMIRHIPNKYTLQTILEDINIDFKDKYDLFYLPLDFKNNCNLGFAFINFVDAFHIVSFYECFRGKRWRRFNSDKICELAYAKFQGKKELINHFEKGSVMNFDSEDKKPLILPTPNPMPKICLPMKFFDAFLVVYPYSDYEILEEEKKLYINSFYGF